MAADDDDFDDLLAGADVLPGSYPESLTGTAADTVGTSVPSQQAEKLVCASHSEMLQQVKPQPLQSGLRQATSASPPVPDLAGLTVAERIKDIFSDISAAVASRDASPRITLSMIPTSPQSESRVRRLCFPGKTAEEAWRFTVVMRIMELIYVAIQTDVVLSKRDIYYRDPALFSSQAVVDRYIDIIAYTLSVPRAMLNVTAAAKGLVAGAFSICRRDGSIFDATREREGLLVPVLKEVLSIDMSAVKWVLVIEKEASFRSVTASHFWNEVSSRGVILTGKGYPDIATRALLHYMSKASPRNGFASPPVFCLVDFDPDGLAIMSTYREGSAALAHENESLRVPRLKWLGLRGEAIGGATDDARNDQELLALTARDRRKAISMLERSDITPEDGNGLDGYNALQTMLMLNTKAELQLLDSEPRGMTDLLTCSLSGLE